MNAVTKPTLNFDDIYMNVESPKELAKLRGDNAVLLTNQAEEFCRSVVFLGMVPSKAYSIAYAMRDEEDGRLVAPDHAAYHASLLMRRPEVVGRIREMRDEILAFSHTERAELLVALREIALGEGYKTADKINAVKQLALMEGYAEESGGGSQTIIFNMPFQPRSLGNEAKVINMTPELTNAEKDQAGQN